MPDDCRDSANFFLPEHGTSLAGVLLSRGSQLWKLCKEQPPWETHCAPWGMRSSLHLTEICLSRSLRFQAVGLLTNQTDLPRLCPSLHVSLAVPFDCSGGVWMLKSAMILSSRSAQTSFRLCAPMNAVHLSVMIPSV